MSGKSAYFITNDVNTKADYKTIKRELDTIRGVTSVSINSQRGLIAVDYDSDDTGPDEIGRKLEEIGYGVGCGLSDPPQQS